MISTDVMISATIRRPPSATHHTPHAARYTLPTIRHLPHASRSLASATAEVSGSSMQERTWERIVKQAGSVSSSAIGSVLESVLGSVIESVLRAYLGAYSQADWEWAIECNWECT